MFYTKFIINLDNVTKLQLLELLGLADSHTTEMGKNEIWLGTSTEKDKKTKLERYLLKYKIPYIKQ